MIWFRLCIAAMVAWAFTFLASCHRAPTPDIPGAWLEDTYALRLQVPVQVESGSSVPFRLSVENRAGYPTDLTVEPPYDFFVTTLEGQEVWRWSHSQSTRPRKVHETISPGERRDFEVVWTGRNNAGRPLPEAVYWVHGVLKMGTSKQVEPEPQAVFVGTGHWLERLLTVSMEAPSRVATGAQVTLRLRVNNVSSGPVALKVGPVPYDFLTTRRDGTDVWRWSLGNWVPLSASDLVLRAREQKEYTVLWDLMDTQGYPLPIGTYLVQGFFQASLGQLPWEIVGTEPMEMAIERR